MTREYTFPDYGIERPVSLLGGVTPLLPGRDVPVVFLIDENHGIDECINQNIANARSLVQSAGVTLIDVESHAGGYQWDDYEGKYHPFDQNRCDNGDNSSPLNTCPKFADSLRGAGATIVGVECRGMLDQQQCDFVPGGSWEGRPAGEHPLNALRSEHYIRTLLEMRSRRGLTGNLILNAGGAHISHIEQWIRDASIEAKANAKAAYVRACAPAYQE
ncbi:MAG: hypothetical protein WCQ21_13790 [Verrucomicrobiota bacterium]|jgi:hypothetical protein